MPVSSQRSLIAASAALFAASAAATVAWCDSMSAMHDMPMPGGWKMSMMWMRMPGQTWPGMALAFLAMWLAMMLAMMLPSLTPILLRYRRAVAGATGARIAGPTAVFGAAYFMAWLMFGLVVFGAGAALASLAMRVPSLARAVPLAIGATVLLAGVTQLTQWKARRLACCRSAFECCSTLPGDALTALRQGLHLGIDCVHCCLGLTFALVAIGLMDLPAMVVVTAAISAERLAPRGERVARLTGLGLGGAGLLWMTRGMIDAFVL